MLKCARAMTELSPIKSQLPDGPIPKEFQPSDWRLRELEKFKQKLAEIQSWDEERAEQEAEKAYQKDVEDRNKIIARELQIRQRYEKMLAQVHAWIPPTPSHRKLKKFMIDELKESIRLDCEGVPDEPQRLSGIEYKQQQIEEVQKNIELHKREIKRVQEAIGWLRTLLKSLHLPLSIK